MNKIIKLILLFLLLAPAVDAKVKKIKKRNIADTSNVQIQKNNTPQQIEAIQEGIQELKTDISELAASLTSKTNNEEGTSIANPGVADSRAEEDHQDNNNEKTDSKDSEEKKDIYLNFENTELSNFINYISELKKINLMPDKALQGVKVSLTIREPLTVDGAWKVFLTVLDMAGFSIVKRGDVDVVIPKKQKTTQPLPSFINVPLETLPDSDENIRYVTFLQNISVNTIQELLKSMLSPEHALFPYPEINGMIITDKSFNIKAAMKVILELDQTGLQESVVVMKLKRANSADVKGLLDSLIQKQETANPLARLLGKQAESTLEYFSPTTRIIAEERTNSLILLGNQKSIKKIEDFISNNIDTELKGTESPLHIYELQNIDATQAKEILEAVTETTQATAAKYGAVRGGVKYFKPMKFQVDKDGNRLIVSSTDKQDWKLLKKTIEDLDKPQPQVAIETLIVTVNLDDEKELGGALRNKYEGQIGKGVNAQSPTFNGTVLKSPAVGPAENSLLGNMINGLTYGLGSSILTFGKGENIWGIFKALKSQANTSILSQPFFTVANKTQANIKVGSTQHVVSQVATGGLEGYTYVEANTDLKITPQINLDGIIRLTINVEFSEFTDPSLGNKDIKQLTTDATIADGQVLVLGGFIKTKVTEIQNKTPLLGDIPVLGWMFKNKQRKVEKNYVFIFMSPTIVKPRQIPGTSLYTRMKLHDATSYIEDTVQTKKTNDPIHNWFFNPEGEDYSHKVVDFANARYQPTTVDIKHDPYYRVHLENEEEEEVYSPEERKREIEEIKAQQLKPKEKSAEEILEQQRIKLKELIADNQRSIKKKSAEEKIAIDDEKREEAKELISSQPKMATEYSQNKQPAINTKPIININRSSQDLQLATNKKAPRKSKSRNKNNINFNQLSKMKTRQTSESKQRSLA